MSQLSSSDLAKRLDVSRARISQYVSEGKLNGCFTGDGRNRRFDFERVAAALGRSLDKGQLMGNGAATRRALAAGGAGSEPGDREVADREPAEREAAPRNGGSGATLLPQTDPDRYELARTAKAEEEAKRLRRQNAEADGIYVLAASVRSEVGRQIAQEVAEFESVLRRAARKIADEMGIDHKAARAIMIGIWREHRSKRSEALSEEAEGQALTGEEREADC